MFGRSKKSSGDDGTTENEYLPEALIAPASKPGRPATPPGGLPPAQAQGAPNRVPTLPPRPSAADIARPADLPRHAELPRRPSEQPPAARAEAEIRQLIVGREISLSGEITACDRLVVEGSVQANLANCRDIDIAESGLFKGAASIDEAEIRGRFEGTLTVRKRLFIRSTGQVIGTIRYGQLEIECGGRLSGDIQSVGADSPAETVEPRRERGTAGVVDVGSTRS